MLYLTLKGVRVALLIGGFTSLIVIPLALLFGVSAGYFGRRVDDVVFFVMTTLASMPGMLLLIALIMVLGKGTLQVCIALGVTGWVGFCRLARGETLKLRELDYVQAARALGVSDLRIILRHILPNLIHLVIITFVLMFSGLVLSEAVLSWLGIGIDGSWGQMIDQARNELSRTPIIWWNLAAASARCSPWCSRSTSSATRCATSPIRARARRPNEPPAHLLWRSTASPSRSPREGGRVPVVDGVHARRSRRARCWRWWASPAAASRSRRCPSCAWCPSPAASSRRAASARRPRPALAAGAGDAGAARRARSA